MTSYAHVTGGTVDRAGRLPRTGTDADGRQVSGFDKLPDADLAALGWLPVVEKRPAYDPATEVLEGPTYEVLKTQVNAHYTAVPMPAPEPDPADELRDAIAAATSWTELRDALLGTTSAATVAATRKPDTGA